MGTTEKKKTVILNQYQLTDPLMTEIQDAYAMDTYRHYVTLVILFLICAFFTWREFSTGKTTLCVLFAITAVVCFVATLLSFISTSNRKKESLRAFRETSPKEGYDLMITIEGKRIRTYLNNAPDVDIKKEEVIGLFESERFFVFQLRGNKLIPLKKDAFLKGNVEMCRAYIPELTKSSTGKSPKTS